MDLNEIVVFARVVQAGSFVAAAQRLGMPKSTVSRKVAELEERLNARLLQRTTRKLHLTDVGRTYYDHCLRIVAEVEDAESAVAGLQAKPRGPLRVTVGQNASYLGPFISDYLKRYPDVRIEVLSTGRVVDLVEEGFDVGIRAGSLADSTLVARSLGNVNWFLVATTAYLKKRGRPRTPEDLKKHDHLVFGTGLDDVVLRLEHAARTVEVAVSPRVTVSDWDVVRSVALSGMGVALLPAFQCVDDLRARRLERVLGDWQAPSTPVHVVYPTRRQLSPKVKAFVDHLEAHMTPPPWELGPLP